MRFLNFIFILYFIFFSLSAFSGEKNEEISSLVDDYCKLITVSNLTSYNCSGKFVMNSALLELIRDEAIVASKEKTLSSKAQSNFREMANKIGKKISQLKGNVEFKCEDVNEQYVICNGNKYVRDIKSNDGLTREIKKIEGHIVPSNGMSPID